MATVLAATDSMWPAVRICCAILGLSESKKIACESFQTLTTVLLHPRSVCLFHSDFHAVQALSTEPVDGLRDAALVSISDKATSSIHIDTRYATNKPAPTTNK